MHLANPNGLWLLSLAVPLVLLYLLDARAKPQHVSALWLWEKALAETESTRPRLAIRQYIRLLLQLLALAALAILASEPGSEGKAVARHVAFVIDVSASMETTNDRGLSRLQEAQQVAQELLENLHPDAQVLVLAAGHSVDVISPFEQDRTTLRRRLARLKTKTVEGRLGPALALARDKLRQTSGERLLVVVTDGALAQETPQLDDQQTPTQFVRVGEATDNLALTQIDVRRTPGKPRDGLHETVVFASVSNFSAQQQSVFLTLRQRNVNSLLSSRRLLLSPGEERSTTLRFGTSPTDQGSGLVLEISPHSGMASDDRAYGIVPMTGDHEVTLVTDQPAQWLTRALRADDDVKLSSIGVADYQATELSPQLWIFVGHCPERVPSTDFVIVAPPSGHCLSVDVEGRIDAPVITHWDEQDPRFRFVSLTELTVEEAARLSPESAAQAMAWAGDLPLMVRLDSPTRRGTIVAFDFERSNWPLRASFVLFVRNLVELSRAQRRKSSELVARTAEPLRVKVPADVTTANATLPNGATRRLRATRGVALLPEVDQAGFYYFSWQGASPGSALVAANLGSALESNPALAELPENRSARRRQNALRADRDLSPWFGLGALLLLLVDAGWRARLPRVRRQLQ